MFALSCLLLEIHALEHDATRFGVLARQAESSTGLSPESRTVRSGDQRRGTRTLRSARYRTSSNRNIRVPSDDIPVTY